MIECIICYNREKIGVVKASQMSVQIDSGLIQNSRSEKGLSKEKD